MGTYCYDEFRSYGPPDDHSCFSIKAHVVCIEKNVLRDRKENINFDSQIRKSSLFTLKKFGQL